MSNGDKDKLGTLQLWSLILTLATLLVILAIIDPSVAAWFLEAGAILSGIIFFGKPTMAGKLAQWWNNLAFVVHWGLIFLEVGGLVYLLGVFVKSKEVEFIIRDKNPKPTP